MWPESTLKLADWARQQGRDEKTASWWFRAGVLPCSAWQDPKTGTILVEPSWRPESSGAAVYARVSQEDPEHPHGCDPQVHDDAGENQVSDRRGGSVGAEDDAKQVSVKEHCGRGVGRGDPPVALQDGVVWLGACDRPEVFSIHAAVFRVWECGLAFESFLPGFSLSFVRSCPGPRRERGEEPGMVRPVRSEPTGLWRVLCRRNEHKCSVYET